MYEQRAGPILIPQVDRYHFYNHVSASRYGGRPASDNHLAVQRGLWLPPSYSPRHPYNRPAVCVILRYRLDRGQLPLAGLGHPLPRLPRTPLLLRAEIIESPIAASHRLPTLPGPRNTLAATRLTARRGRRAGRAGSSQWPGSVYSRRPRAAWWPRFSVKTAPTPTRVVAETTYLLQAR